MVRMKLLLSWDQNYSTEKTKFKKPNELEKAADVCTEGKELSSHVLL